MFLKCLVAMRQQCNMKRWVLCIGIRLQIINIIMVFKCCVEKKTKSAPARSRTRGTCRVGSYVTATLLALLHRLAILWPSTSIIALVALAFPLWLCCLCVALAVCIALVLALVLPLIQIAFSTSPCFPNAWSIWGSNANYALALHIINTIMIFQFCVKTKNKTAPARSRTRMP